MFNALFSVKVLRMSADFFCTIVNMFAVYRIMLLLPSFVDKVKERKPVDF